MVNIQAVIKKVEKRIEKEMKRNNTMACQKWGSRLKTLYQAKIVLEKCKKRNCDIIFVSIGCDAE